MYISRQQHYLPLDCNQNPIQIPRKEKLRDQDHEERGTLWNWEH